MLSATIITLNEEKDLPRCLASLKGWVDEIVVVDCGSIDKTVEIAKEFGAKVYLHVFDNYATQKNYAKDKTTQDWILSIDADEEIEKELAKEIINEIQSPKYDSYSIPRKNIIFGKLIKHTRWDPELDRHVWLWKKDKGKWSGDVHEEVVVDGAVGKLINAKIHHQYENVSEFLNMMNRYSDIDSKEMIANGRKFRLLQLFGQPVYNFLVRYFYRLGFLDGWRGLVLSYLMAVYHFNLWVKVWYGKK